MTKKNYLLHGNINHVKSVIDDNVKSTCISRSGLSHFLKFPPVLDSDTKEHPSHEECTLHSAIARKKLFNCHVGHILAEKRRSHKISRKDIAHFVGIPLLLHIAIEHGMVDVSAATLSGLCNYLHLNVHSVCDSASCVIQENSRMGLKVSLFETETSDDASMVSEEEALIFIEQIMKMQDNSRHQKRGADTTTPRSSYLYDILLGDTHLRDHTTQTKHNIANHWFSLLYLLMFQVKERNASQRIK